MTDYPIPANLTDALAWYYQACERDDKPAQHYYWLWCQYFVAGEQPEHDRRQREIERARQMEARIGDRR